MNAEDPFEFAVPHRVAAVIDRPWSKTDDESEIKAAPAIIAIHLIMRRGNTGEPEFIDIDRRSGIQSHHRDVGAGESLSGELDVGPREYQPQSRIGVRKRQQGLGVEIAQGLGLDTVSEHGE